MNDVDVKIQTVTTGPTSGDVSARGSEKLTVRNVENITNVINATVISLQEKVNIKEEKDGLKLDTVELSFGIDLEFETGIPIIGPIFGARAKSGATFQVQITLKR